MNAIPRSTPAPNHDCPLCGGPNNCAPARSVSFETPCWCRSAVFSPTLLARVAEADRGRACICARCAARVAADPR